MADFWGIILSDLEPPFNSMHFFNWYLLANGLEEEKNKSCIAEISILTRQDITSVELYRDVILLIAQVANNPGRLMVIHYLSEEVWKQFLPKLKGISYKEYGQEFPMLQLTFSRKKVDIMSLAT